MWKELIISLLLAHFVADFVLQSSKSCKEKANLKWRSKHHYFHAAIVFSLSWLVSWKIGFWWCALVIGLSHLCIDIWKSYRDDKVTWFIVDQAMHILVIAIVSWIWILGHDWHIPFKIDTYIVASVVAILVCWKPANIFIKMMLRHYCVNMPDENAQNFSAGA